MAWGVIAAPWSDAMPCWGWGIVAGDLRPSHTGVLVVARFDLHVQGRLVEISFYP